MMKTFALLLLCMPASAQMAISPGRATYHATASATPLAIVQSATASGLASFTFTLSAAPVTGNVLLLAVSSTTTPTVPAGFTLVKSLATMHSGLAVYQKAAASGTTTYAVSGVNGSGAAGILYEVAGANASPINAAPTGSATATSPAATPSVIGTLAFAFLASYAGTAPTAITSGWTLDFGSNVSRSFGAGHRNVLTTDTTSAISAAFTTAAGENGTLTVLIAPR
jgi:hypothetical protein